MAWANWTELDWQHDFTDAQYFACQGEAPFWGGSGATCKTIIWPQHFWHRRQLNNVISIKVYRMLAGVLYIKDKYHMRHSKNKWLLCY